MWDVPEQEKELVAVHVFHAAHIRVKKSVLEWLLLKQNRNELRKSIQTNKQNKLKLKKQPTN